MSHAHAALHALARHLADGLATAVPLGRPHERSELSLWPWQLLDLPAARNPTGQRPPDGQVSRPAVRVEWRLLLVTNGTEHAIERLAAAHRLLADQPVLVWGTAGAQDTAQVSSAPLPTADLAAVFSAAQLPLQLCSAWVLRCPL